MTKNLSRAAALLALGMVSLSTQAANVDVSINIGQPNYFGRIDPRDFGRPVLIYNEPRVIYPVAAPRDPVYLHVPPGHAKNWRKHCHKYNACNERVYFVQDNWYQREYVPRYQAAHHDGHDYRDERREERREDKYEKHEDKHEDKYEKNNGHGKGHGKNH